MHQADGASGAALLAIHGSATHGRRWWTLAVLCFTLVVISVDTTIVNVALPTIQADLGDAGTVLADTARTSFMNGWTTSLLIAAAVALAAAGATLALLPARAREDTTPAHRRSVPDPVVDDQIPTAA
jgi:MFS family permease